MPDICFNLTIFEGRQLSMEDNLLWKTTFDGRRPLFTFDGRWSSMEVDLWWITIFDERQPSIEDVLHWRDFEIPLCHIPPLRSFFFANLRWGTKNPQVGKPSPYEGPVYSRTINCYLEENKIPNSLFRLEQTFWQLMDGHTEWQSHFLSCSS